MSASREKNKRKLQVEEPVSSGAEKKGMSKSLKTTLIVVCAVLAVAAIVFCSMLTDGFFATHAIAAKVGGRNMTPAAVNYYYRQAYNNFSKYAQYLGIDTSKSLSSQYIDEEKTQSWADSLLDTGLNSAAETYAIYDRATAEGFKLSEDQLKEIDESISMISAYAPLQGFKDANAYIAAIYGSGCNEKNFREYLEVTGVVQSYLSDIYNNLSFSDSEIDAEYEANKNEYDTVSYRMISITPDMFEEGAENVADKVKELADTIIAAADSEEAFVKACAEEVPDAVKEQYADEAATIHKDASHSAVSSTYADWLFDEARQANDKTMIENDDTCSVVFFLSRNDHDVVLPNVRHILFKVDDTSDAEAMASAKEKAENVLALFEEGDKTEDSFAKLASEYSDDSSAQYGGLISNIYPDQMVANFSDWCFDESRQVGDTGIVETEYGYHVMYFVGLKNHKTVLVDNALKENAYSAKSEELSANDGYTIVPFGARFITK